MESSTFLALATIAAIFLGPVVALWIQRISETKRNRRNRKLFVFQELMATRALHPLCQSGRGVMVIS